MTPEVLDFAPMVTRALFDLDLAAAREPLTERQRRDFRRLLARDRDVRLYHATSTEHPVWARGLLPTSSKRRRSYQSGSGYVYLSYDPMRALGFAAHGYPGQGPYVVYAVVMPVRQLRPDPDQLANKRYHCERPDIGHTLTDSMIHGGGARVKGRIETWRIAMHGYFDATGARTTRPDGHEWGERCGSV